LERCASWVDCSDGLSETCGQILCIWTPVILAEVKKKGDISVKCSLSEELCVLTQSTIHRISLSSDDFYSHSILFLGLIHVEIFNFLNVLT
jgi:hypothetical protein